MNYATIKINGNYVQFCWRKLVISFLHGKDLLKILSVNQWDSGYLAVRCLGKVKGEYEDYIDMNDILEKLYMDPELYLKGIEEVRVE